MENYKIVLDSRFYNLFMYTVFFVPLHFIEDFVNDFFLNKKYEMQLKHSKKKTNRIIIVY